jgi:hypothetical protein
MRKINVQSTAVRQYTQQDVQNVIIPSPIGGWNAIDPLALMEPKYAPVLQNWVPRTGWVETRPGYSAWAQSLSTSAVESLMVYRPSGAEKMFAATNGFIYDVSTEGPVTTAQSGLSNNRWQYINFTPANGANYIYMVNGQDAPRYYDGTTWTQPSITGGPSPSTFTNIAEWKRRIFFVPTNSTVAWYLATDAVSGALAGSLDIGALIQKGGKLVAIGSLTTDGGEGPQNLLCLISSRGEVVVYQGTDPTNSSAFALVGVFYIAPPLGNRCFMSYGADLAMITLQGVIPLSQAFPLDSDAIRGVAITNKIQNTMLQSAQQFQSNFGWEMSHFPAQGLFILNVPTATNSAQVQFVQNAITGAWCEFTGWNANCFAIYNDGLYFGDNKGNVAEAWTGAADLVQPIISDMQCAFNYFGDPGRIKQVTQIKPNLITSGALTPTIGIDVDFGSTSPTSTVTSFTSTGSQYDVSLYDVGVYSGGLSVQTLWQATQAEGTALAVRMKVNLLPAGAGGQSVFDTGVFDTMVFDDFGVGTNTLEIMAFNGIVRFGGAI